jgi:ppGpp synthetase/RelA/SpoT-type nucleotidyltranferase
MPMNNQFDKIEEVKEIVRLNSDKLHSYFNVQGAIDEVHVRYHHALNELLGKSNDTSEVGKLTTQFEFDNKDFILFSFKSYKGQIPSNIEQQAKHFPRRRFNLYRKGRIWSDPSFNYGRNFYSFLDKLDEAFNETPINLISYVVFKFKTKGTSGFHITVTQDETKKKFSQFLYFPSTELLKAINHSQLNEVLAILDDALKDEFLRNPFPLAKVEDTKKRLLSLKPWLGLEDIPVFAEVIESFKRVFRIGNANLDEQVGNGQTLQQNIRFAALLYAYNHLPFDLHLFYPPTKKVGKDDLYTLMVALDPSKALDPKDEELFNGIVEKSPNLPEYESDLIKKAKLNAESLLRWKYIYEQNENKYATFISTVENVCRSLCVQNHIKKSVVSSRLKSFESFYNKLIERANEDSDDQLKYKDAVENPDKYKDFVFKAIRDIAGVRIICVFNDEVGKLEELFKKGLDDSDLVRSDIKKYSQNRIADGSPDFEKHKDDYNYRGFHVTVRPGEARRRLVEYRNIDDTVQCEIQIRTYFAHGWSDVEHPMVYKDKLYLEVIDKVFRNSIETKLSEISRSLKTYDEEIATLKERRDNYKFPITE